MPLRALRLFPIPTRPDTTLASSLSFATTLQLAAGQAWTRRVFAHTQPLNGGTRGVRATRQCQTASKRTERNASLLQAGPSTMRNIKPLPNNPNSTSKKSSDALKLTRKSPPRIQRPVERQQAFANVTYYDPYLNGYEPSDAEIFKSDDEIPGDFLSDIPSSDLPKVSNSANTEPLNPRMSSTLQVPSSPTSLHRNILYLTNVASPTPRLPVLVDYHAHYSKWQSIASFNLLISLAIRNQSYGISHRLLNDLSLSNLTKTVETYQLEVRNFIHQGLWNKAWMYVQDLKDSGQLPAKKNDGIKEIPFPIWLEFFRPIKKPRIRKRLIYDSEGKLAERYFEEVLETKENMKARQRLLSQYRPRSMPPLSRTTPHAVYCIVQLLIRSGDTDRALKLTQAFFRAIPKSLTHSHIRWCLEIIHAHMVSCSAKNGLPRFYEARRTMISLLKLHRSLRPNSKTLYLILAPLQRAKICGTKAWKTLAKFKAEWGPFVEDRRVQRRVADLALKEGRMDIVKKITDMERTERYRRQRILSEDQMTRRIYHIRQRLWQVRLPQQQVYSRNGKEARLWYRLRARVRCKIYQRELRRRRRRKVLQDLHAPKS
ncbi:hypothetical protein BDN70DRAFT_931262 [Pholiota conissans]|uniref:Uncharacterized protein n=1 Tax=Pholiota conissans TaxID=109636 RepID=A0A9P6D2U4_9AGAR|nr:hypothetical protein BDN70DRAFT_931262 [Pholiota conissans]